MSEWIFDRILNGYERALHVVLRHQFLTLMITLTTIATTIYLYIVVPKGFFPQQDTGRLAGTIRADQDTSFQTMNRLLARFASAVSADPAVDGVIAFAGGSSSNTAKMFVNLRPLKERKMTADEVMARLRKQLSQIPGAQLILQATQDLRIGGRSSSAQYQYTLQGESIDEIASWADKMQDAMKKIHGVVDISSDQQSGGLLAGVQIDRDTASRLGITPLDIDNILGDAFSQKPVSTIYESLNQYRVIMEVDPRFQQNPAALQNVYITGSNGSLVPLSAFAKYVPSTTSLAVNHSAQFPSITLSFNLSPGVSLGNAVDQINDAARQLGMPASIIAQFSGTAQAYQDSLATQPYLIAAALIAVYIVLGILYESLIHPITILSTLPSAGVGALLALLLCRTDLSVIALIGIILLIGIVKKNAIMMIDFALDAERNQNKSPEESIFQAAVLRFRPITMTTLAALLGGLPLAIGGGVGAELRQPLGIAIVGGLIFSQMLTLFTTPVVYLYLDRLRLWFYSRRHPNLHPAPQT